jgi:hypothetical protein
VGKAQSLVSTQAAAQWANEQLAQQVNDQIALSAGEISRNLLTGSFRSLFRVERALEAAESDVFDLDTDPDRLDVQRMDPAQWLYFPYFLIGQDLPARRYAAYNEYDFVLVLDVSRSMTSGSGEPKTWMRHTFYRLKFLAYSLLLSAGREGYKCRLILYDQGTPISWESQDDEGFAYAVLELLDARVLYQSPAAAEPVWPWQEVLDELVSSPHPMMVAIASDFLDPVQGHCDEAVFLSYLAELRFCHRLVVLRVNELRDLTLPIGGEKFSLRDLHYGEDGDPKRLSVKEHQQNRQRFQEWLGEVEAEGVGPGRLASVLAAYGIHHQLFVAGQTVGQELEDLTMAILED